MGLILFFINWIVRLWRTILTTAEKAWSFPASNILTSFQYILELNTHISRYENISYLSVREDEFITWRTSPSLGAGLSLPPELPAVT